MNTFEESIKQQNRRNFILIIIIATIMMLLIVLSRLYFDKEMSTYISICMGIIGTTIIGLSVAQSSNAILEFSRSKFDFNIQKSKYLLKNNLYMGIGTILVLSSLILQAVFLCV